MAAAVPAPVVPETKPDRAHPQAELKKYRAALLARIIHFVYTAIKPELDDLFEECAERVVSATTREEIHRVHGDIRLNTIWDAAKKFAELREDMFVVGSISELDAKRNDFYRDALAWHRESKQPWKIADNGQYGRYLASDREEDRPLGDPEIGIRGQTDPITADRMKEDWKNWCRIWRTVAFTMVEDDIVSDFDETNLISSDEFNPTREADADLAKKRASKKRARHDDEDEDEDEE